MARLNEEAVKALPVPNRGNKVWYFPAATIQGAKCPRGFGVRVTAGGQRAFVMNFRLKGREHRYTIGTYPDWSVVNAVRHARDLRQRIDRGENPLDDRKPEVPAKTVADVIDEFMARYVRNKDRPLRTAAPIESAFNRFVKPRIGKLGVHELRRSHVADMLDRVEDQAGPVAADRTRAYLRKCLVWWSERDDEFNFNAAFGARVHARANAAERARTRVLSDDELRLLWPLLAGTFGALVKTLLLTAQRRDEVSHMRRSEIGADGVWMIPAERYKTKRPNAVPLSAAALKVIDGQPAGDLVFASSVGTPFSAYGKSKARLDKAAPISNWTLHDLRRTAKTLMMRAGVRPDISERVLGHAIGGVEGVYDRHSYAEEKRDAVERLAAMIERIVGGGA